MSVEITEAEAREYCRLLAIDPDELVADPSNRSMAYVTCRRWQAECQWLLRHKAAMQAVGTTERKTVVDDATVARCCAAYSVAIANYGSRLQGRSAHEVGMRAALEAAPGMVADAHEGAECQCETRGAIAR